MSEAKSAGAVVFGAERVSASSAFSAFASASTTFIFACSSSIFSAFTSIALILASLSSNISAAKSASGVVPADVGGTTAFVFCVSVKGWYPTS